MNYQKSKNEIGAIFHFLSLRQLIVLIVLLPLLGVVNLALAASTAPATVNFDHLKTGFNLTGAHIMVRCETCHIGGVFKGTPRDCASCHMTGNRMGATLKPDRHVTTLAPCDSCHRTTGWTPASFSHVGVAPGGCMSCHGTMATAKPAGHILTTESCDKCHRSTAWLPAGYNHLGVAPGTCTKCHGSSATGVPNGHLGGMNPGECDGCHRTSAWIPANYNHIGVVPGTCADCHNGVKAKGVGGSNPSRYPLNKQHVSITLWPSCDSCHKSTTSFANASVHRSVTVPTGSCTSCHYRSSHEGSGTKSCDSSGCHRSTSSWD